MLRRLSFIIPIFNESENIPETYRQLMAVIKNQLANSIYEIIFVNDGSSDNSLEILKKLQKKDKLIHVISFRRNMGKATALTQGFLKATGDIAVTLDGDLQDGPENIPQMLEKLRQGFDMIVGWKKERHDPLEKRVASYIFNNVVKQQFGTNLHDMNCGLKAIKKDAYKRLHPYGEHHRFIPVLALQLGFKVNEIIVTHHPRLHGKSKYGKQRILRGFFDLITVLFFDRYGKSPMYLFGFLGGASLIFGTLIGFYLSILHFMGESIGRRPLILLAMLLVITGIQMFSIGLIAEMLTFLSHQYKEVPIDYEA